MANKPKKEAIGRAGRVEREARANRIVQYSMYAVIAIVLIVVIGGSISEFIVKPNQPVVTVDDVEISTKEFQSRVKFIRQMYVSMYMQNFEMLQYFSSISAEGLDEIFESYYAQLVTLRDDLDNFEYIGFNVITDLADEIVIKKEADQLGISISEEELEIGIQEFFNYYENSEVEETSSDELTDETEENESDAAEQEPVDNSSTPEPTVDPYEQYLENYETNISFYESELGFSEDDFIEFIENQLIKEKLFNKLTEDVSPNDTQITAEYMVTSTLDLANVTYFNFSELNNWEMLLTMFDEEETDEYTFGDYGSFTKYDLPEVYEVVKDASVGELVGPIETGNGFFLIYVKEINDEFELSAETFTQKKGDVFETWLDEVRLEYEVFYRDDWLNRVPTEPEIPFQYRIQ